MKTQAIWYRLLKGNALEAWCPTCEEKLQGTMSYRCSCGEWSYVGMAEGNGPLGHAFGEMPFYTVKPIEVTS